MEIRPATIDDAEAIRSIYNAEVTGSVHVFDLVPRTLAEQQAWLADHAGAHPAIVAVDDGTVAGFGSLS
ncbi:MAG: N-acetyltransferase, partial [Actinobacteria bacterium]|nr:N-acetyltransferase [Actinomycetota bacterium]